MPIEIRELHIKAIIEDTNTASKNTGTNGSSVTANQSSPKIDDLVGLCVEKVLDILQEKKER